MSFALWKWSQIGWDDGMIRGYKVESDMVVLYRWVRECLCRVMSEEVDGVDVTYVLGACAGFVMCSLRSAESLLPALRGWCSRYDRMHCT
jgi:hypothetical protein